MRPRGASGRAGGGFVSPDVLWAAVALREVAGKDDCVLVHAPAQPPDKGLVRRETRSRGAEELCCLGEDRCRDEELTDCSASGQVSSAVHSHAMNPGLARR